MDGAALVHRAGGHAVARPLQRGHRLARDGGLIERRLARDDRAIRGDALAGADDDLVADGELLDGHDACLAAAHNRRLLRREAHELLERLARLPFRACLEVLADRDERHDHARRLEIEVLAVRRDEREIPVAEAPAHAEDREYAERGRRHRAHAHEAVHVRRAVEEIAEASDVVVPVEIHDGQHEQKLRERERDRILRPIEHRADERGHRQAEKLGKKPVHRDVERRQQEGNRPDEPAAHLRRVPLQRILRRRWLLRLCALDARAVARGLDGRDDGGGIRLLLVIAQLQRVCEQVDAHLLRARELANGLFHTRGASRTGHARYGKSFFLHLGFSPLGGDHFMTFCSVATSSSTTSS